MSISPSLAGLPVEYFSSTSSASEHEPDRKRTSMEEYYETQTTRDPEASEVHAVQELASQLAHQLALEPTQIPTDLPPPYETIFHPSYLRQRSEIQPREDEGHEVLPPYSTALSVRGVFGRKQELEGAIHRAHDRTWNRVCVVLQGTLLTLHEITRSSARAFTKCPRGSTEHIKLGPLLKKYSLQHAEVGIAADYKKKTHVIRVRAEADQFLLSCSHMESFVSWLQYLSVAIDLAPPLEVRNLPQDISIPRSHRVNRRRSVALQSARQDDQRPQEVANTATATSNPEIDEHTESEPNQSPASASQLNVHTVSPRSSARDVSSSGRALHLYRSRSTSVHPSVSPETGKWQPQHHWSALYDMLYAKRCMAVLTSQSPRKTNYLIMRGKQWIVDWATGALIMCQPPDYGEEVQSGKLIVGRYETTIRVS